MGKNKAIDGDLMGDIIFSLETFRAVQQHRGAQFFSSVVDINKLIDRVKYSSIKEADDG